MLSNAKGIVTIKKFTTKGFSLLELIIVFAIIGILAAISYPNYQNYLTRARRNDGQTALFDLANRMEQYYFEQNTYNSATIGSGKATDVLNNNLSPEGWYSLSITRQSDADFELKATPNKAQATQDYYCQSLTFNSQGVKSITNGPMGQPTGNVNQCWR